VFSRRGRHPPLDFLELPQATHVVVAHGRPGRPAACPRIRESRMKRTSSPRPADLPARVFASNPALLIGAAFEIGMLLGRRSGRTALGRKVRDKVGDVATQVVKLAPDAMATLVPDLVPVRTRARRRSSKR
jgi:hypothetical protein